MYREAQVRAGMELLDKKLPGWENRLNLETLNIDSIYSCTLGQLYGSYGHGTWELGITASPWQYGFSSIDFPGLPTEGNGAELTKTWRELVTQRRQPVPERKLVPIPERELVAV